MSAPPRDCVCAPESRTGLGFCSSHPPGPAPRFSARMHTCVQGLSAHLAPVAGGHSRCALQLSRTDAPSDLDSLWPATPGCSLSIPPRGLLRQSIFHLPAGQLAALPPAPAPLPLPLLLPFLPQGKHSPLVGVWLLARLQPLELSLRFL